MVVLRFLGLLLLAFAVAALGLEAMAAWQTGGWRALALGEIWFKIDSASLDAAQAGVQRYVAPWLWEPGITSILRLPGWVVFGVPGGALVWIAYLKGRKPRRLLGMR